MHRRNSTGTHVHNLLIATIFLLTACGGGGGSGGGSNAPTAIAPTASLSTSTNRVQAGAEFTITWSSTNADSCLASGSWSGERATSGSEAITADSAGNRTYMVTCAGAGGERSASVDIEITSGNTGVWDYTEIPYGADDPDRQWLNIHLAYDQTKPSPVYVFAHANGGSAYGMTGNQLAALAGEGYTTVSWESVPTIENNDQVRIAAEDAQVMFDWVRTNADIYNLDPDHIVIGGRSRGSVVSWQLAHSNHPAIKGIYMYNALPRGAWQDTESWNPADEVTIDSPQTYLVYGPDFDDDDGHNPGYVDPVIARYEELDIAERITRYVDMWGDYQDGKGNWTNDGEIMHYFPEFVAALEGIESPPAAGTSALFMGHSFFAPIARQMTFHAALLGLNDYTQYVEFSGGATGTPLALWQDEQHRDSIQTVLDTGDIDLVAMPFGPDEGYSLWIDYALSKNPDTTFVIGLPWIDFPGDYDTASYESRYLEAVETVWTSQIESLRANYPEVDVISMPYGFAATELRNMYEAGQLPGVSDLIGDNPETSLFKDRKGHGHGGGLLLDLAEFIWLDIVLGIDLESYEYNAGHSVNLKEVAQSILEEQAHYFD
jgi:hypothetical protein